MLSKRQKAAAKQKASQRQHALDATRMLWTRKPQTQVKSNRKHEERRSWCRKAKDDGAFYFSRCSVDSKHCLKA